MSAQTDYNLGVAGKLAKSFINSKLTPLIIIATVLLGLAAIILLPREEEPQIKVPMIDVIVSLPGFSAKEVEERASKPMEKLLWEIPGVEYIYSTSRPGQSLVIVRFKVGESMEQSLVKLNQKLNSNFDRIPPGVSMPLIKARAIDDVPILALTLHSPKYDPVTLRRVAAEVEDSIKQVPLVSETSIIGGLRREIRVVVDPALIASRNLSLAGLVPYIQQSNRQYRSGAITSNNKEFVVESGGFLRSADDVASIVVGVYQGRPVLLSDVATIIDDAGDPSSYVFFGTRNEASEIEPAVTITVAKRAGANAISVAEEVLRKVEGLKGTVVPNDLSITVTRHYGETAAEKSNELLLHMAIAILSVSLLIMFVLGWRESIVVAVAIPSTLALTLLVFYLYGFTLNRITLFALIFSIGILVDDAIVVVENITRHFNLKDNDRSLVEKAIDAVSEVGNPTILATFAVIAAVLPMAMVGGLMGPYMRPIPIGASAAMLFSLFISFIITPWAAVRVLAKHEPSTKGNSEQDQEGRATHLYRRFMGHMLHNQRARYKFLGSIIILLLLAFALVGIGWVKVKMLPFDNKSEFQVILNMPEGSALELTAKAAKEIGQAISTEVEVANYQMYVGVASPYNFNGLVRHYFMRGGASNADIQVNLVGRSERSSQSHDFVKRVRARVAEIAARYNARVALAEVPPGPPVLQTLVAEIYGPSDEARAALASQVRKIFSSTPGVVDIDWYVEDAQPRDRFVVDKVKAALHGISSETVAQTLRLALAGDSVGIVHEPEEKEDLNITLQLPRAARTAAESLLALRVRTGDANALPEPLIGGSSPPLVPLGELVTVEHDTNDLSRYRKNLMPVTYVIGDVAGAAESPAYAIFDMNRAISKIDASSMLGGKNGVTIYNSNQPSDNQNLAIKWDGEWHITLEVFRDLGLAFAACLVLIYVLMVGWFKSFLTPVIVMAAIPFSLVGILPAHGLMGAFFTATSMIGFMAGAGIVVRNSIILVDFIELRRRNGAPLDQAVIDAGAIRFRPMLLTAMAVAVGAAVILFDPIFQGLAISLMAGEIASLLISRMAVPVLYYMAAK